MHSLTSLTPRQSITVDGIQLNYQASLLTREHPTLVLIHGFGASLETWGDIWPLLVPHHSVVRVDLKGAGFSSKPRDQHYGPVDQAHLISALLRMLSLTNVILVGHSLGGGIALFTCLNSLGSASDFVKGLILIDSAGYPQQLPFFVNVFTHTTTRFLASIIPKGLSAHYVLQRIFHLKERITPDRIHRYSFFFDLPGSRQALYQTAKQIVPDNVNALTSQFGRIAVPTLVVWGELDPVILVENGRRFNRDIPNSRLLVLADTGHVPQEERPLEVFKAIEEFVRTLK